MNQERGDYQLGMDAWFINMDNDLFSMEFTKDHFETVIPYDTISISRSGKTVKKAYVYILKDLIKIPYDDFQVFMDKHDKDKETTE